MMPSEAKAYLDEQAEKFLSDARQFWVGLLLATQYVHQLEEGVRRAVYGNTAIKLIGPIEYSDRVSLAREMHTTPEFIGSMRAYDRSHTEWAAYVRTSNMTPQALRLCVPYGVLERMPKADRPPVAQTRVLPSVPEPTNAHLLNNPDIATAAVPRTQLHPVTPPNPAHTLDANTRIDKALRLLTPPLRTIIETELHSRYKEHWREYLSVADGTDPTTPLDPYAALKTLIDNWQSCFKAKFKSKTRVDVSKALEGRNAIAHTGDEISSADAIAYLIAIRDIAIAISAAPVTDTVKTFIEDQMAAVTTTSRTLKGSAVTHVPPATATPTTVPNPDKPFLKPGKDW